METRTERNTTLLLSAWLKTKDYSHVVYSRDKLIDCYMKANNWSWDEAEDWIEYNVERALPYYGAEAPKILSAIAIYPSNKKYIPLKIIID